MKLADGRVIRKCESCNKDFELTKEQARRGINMWPSNCSRACLNTRIQNRIQKDVRLIGNCKICGKNFKTTKSKPDRAFCSRACVYESRWGKREEQINKGKSCVEEILNNPLARQRVRSKIARVCSMMSCFDLKDDIFQEWILALILGQKMKIENVANKLIADRSRKGLTGEATQDKISFGPETDQDESYLVPEIDAKLDLEIRFKDDELKVIRLIEHGYTRDEVRKIAPKGKVEKYVKLFSDIRDDVLREFLEA